MNKIVKTETKYADILRCISPEVKSGIWWLLERPSSLSNLYSELERITGVELNGLAIRYYADILCKKGFAYKENGEYGLTKEGEKYRPLAGLALSTAQKLGRSAYQILGDSHNYSYDFVSYELQRLRENGEADLKSLWSIPFRHLKKLERIGIIEISHEKQRKYKRNVSAEKVPSKDRIEREIIARVSSKKWETVEEIKNKLPRGLGYITEAGIRYYLSNFKQQGIITETKDRFVKLTPLGIKFVDDFLYLIRFALVDECLLNEIGREVEIEVDNNTLRGAIRVYLGTVFKL